ncbi:MAG: chromate resistance protein ChrB domain-containing protein [Pseudomonadota bacterium]
MSWSLLIISTPTENTTARMRAWRGLKASGAAVLRDGVYLIPATDDTVMRLADIAADVTGNGGNAYQLALDSVDPYDFVPLFDRTAEFAAVLADISACRAALRADSAHECIKQARKIRKNFGQLAALDFFPGEAQNQAAEALADLEVLVHRALSPNEPGDLPETAIERLQLADYQGRVWATRSRPWVDRLACAWLIRRFIDPAAQLLWLADPADCPADALGFDFDGARFSHTGGKVSFEALLASFGFETPALLRLGALVHFLDAGGVQPPEASGVEKVLAGMREAITDDDQLLQVATSVFDGLMAAFEKDPQT